MFVKVMQRVKELNHTCLTVGDRSGRKAPTQRAGDGGDGGMRRRGGEDARRERRRWTGRREDVWVANEMQSPIATPF